MNMKSVIKLPSFENSVLFLFMIILPLCMRYVIIPVTGPEARLMNSPVSYDVFHYAKTYLVIGTAMVLLFNLGIKVLTGQAKMVLGLFQKILMALGTVILVSSLLSPYRELAFQGASDNFENVGVHLSYLALAFVFSQSGKNAESYLRTFAQAAAVVVFLSSVVGIAQSFKINPLEFAIFKSYILPGSVNPSVNVFLNTGSAYSFFGNPDYVGSAFALMMPFVVFEYFSARSIALKLVYALIFALGQYTVLGAGALGGILFVPISYILVCGMLIRRKAANAKRDTVVILGAYVLICALFYKTNSTLDLKEFAVASAIHTVLAMGFWLYSIMSKKLFAGLLAGALVVSGVIGYSMLNEMESQPDPFTLQEVRIEGNQIYLETQSLTMRIVNKNGEIEIYDGSLRSLDTTINKEKQIVAREEHYDKVALTITERGGYTVLEIPRYRLNFFVLPNEFRYMNMASVEDKIDEPFMWLPSKVSRLGSKRVYIYQCAIKSLMVHPLLGSGADSFKAAIPQNDVAGKQQVGLSPKYVIDKPHSLYFQYLSQFGLVGAVLIFTLTYLGIKGITKDIVPHSVSAWAAIISYLGVGLVNDSKVMFSPYFWILLGIIAVFTATKKEKKLNTDHSL